MEDSVTMQKTTLTSIQRSIDALNQTEGGGRLVGQISDGHHSFDELYEFRKVYNAGFFNELAKDYYQMTVSEQRTYHSDSEFKVHRSWRHHDGQLCFGGGWFVVVAMLPDGQITNHYRAEDWDLFKVPAVEKALFEFDQHTPQDVLRRIENFLKQ